MGYVYLFMTLWTTGGAMKVKVKFDFAHLAESILAEQKSRDQQTPPPRGAGHLASSCPLGGDTHAFATPATPGGSAEKPRHAARRTRLSIYCDVVTHSRLANSIVASRCHVLTLKCTKFDSILADDLPQTPLGELTAFPQTP